MVDREQLREALGWVDDYVAILRDPHHNITLEPLEVIEAAARLVLDSPQAWLCEEHGVAVQFQSDHQKIRVALVALDGEEPKGEYA